MLPPIAAALRLVQRQPLDESLTATLAGRDQIALVILLNEADRLNAGHDRLAQIATEPVHATFLPAAITRVPLLKEGRLIAGPMKLNACAAYIRHHKLPLF